MTRLGFLGAMNRDIVVQGTAETLLALLGIGAAPLVETAISDSLALSGATQLRQEGAADHLGGSAFNAARVAALLNTDQWLDLAFFGVAGTIGAASPHHAALLDWGIDASGVLKVPQPPATCLALVEPGGRTLLTASGANAGVADWIRSSFEELALSVSRCDIIHVTSFLDPATPGLIAELLRLARRHNPALIVSLDPGMAWIGPGGAGLESLLGQTRILHLNNEEYDALCGAGGPGPAMAMLAPEGSIVARTHLGATVFSAGQNGPVAATLSPRALPDAVDIVDATGAGDTFCGAFLWARGAHPGDPLGAAALGFELARLKIGMRGPLAMSAAVRSAVQTWTQVTR